MVAGDEGAAHLARDGGEHLDVEKGEVAFAEVLDEVEEGDFGGVGNAVEHGFAGEEPADGDAVDAAGQLAALPAFEAVGVAGFVEASIGFDKFAGDPGFRAARSGGGTVFDDLREGAVNGDFEDVFAKELFQAVGDVELAEFQNRARIGRPPGDGIDGPRENAAAIGEEQAVHG